MKKFDIVLSIFNKKIKQILFKNILSYQLIFFLVGIINLIWQVNFFEYCFGDKYDGRFNNFVLENFYQNLIGNLDDFKKGNLFYPLENNILLSDNHWVMGIFYAIPRIIGFNNYVSYNFFCLFTFSANYWVCFYVFRKLGFSKNSSALGAFIFAFNQIILQKITHIQLNFKIFIPLSILFFKYYLQKKDFRYIAYLILCISFQQLTSSYNGFFLAFFIAIIIIVYISQFKFHELKNIFPKNYSPLISITSIVFSISILIALSIPYIDTIKLYNIKYFYLNNKYFDYEFFFTISDSLIWRFITNYFELDLFKIYSENQYFMGFGVIFLILFCFVKKDYYKNLSQYDRLIIKSTLITLIIFWTSEFNPLIHYLKIFPPFKYLRANTRFFLVIFFGFVYIATLVLNYLENKKTVYYKIFYYFIIILIIIENLFFRIQISDINKYDNDLESYREIVRKYDNDQEKIILFTQSNFDILESIYNENVIINAFINNKKIKIVNGYSGYMFLENNFAKNCNQSFDIIDKNEKIYNNLTNKNFRYDRKKLLVFHDKKLCKKIFNK